MTDYSAFTMRPSHERLAQVYAPYAVCPRCNAFAGNPCRDDLVEHGAAKRLLSKPHRERPLRERSAA